MGNAHGQVHANVPNGTVTAVTWGVFPNAEIRQPTVVDIESFLAWKYEAFALWDEWAEVFDAGSPQRQIISSIQSSWFLMNVVDNDYMSSDLFAHLARFLEKRELLFHLHGSGAEELRSAFQADVRQAN